MVILDTPTILDLEILAFMMKGGIPTHMATSSSSMEYIKQYYDKFIIYTNNKMYYRSLKIQEDFALKDNIRISGHKAW